MTRVTPRAKERGRVCNFMVRFYRFGQRQAATIWRLGLRPTELQSIAEE